MFKCLMHNSGKIPIWSILVVKSIWFSFLEILMKLIPDLDWDIHQDMKKLHLEFRAAYYGRNTSHASSGHSVPCNRTARLRGWNLMTNYSVMRFQQGQTEGIARYLAYFLSFFKRPGIQTSCRQLQLGFVLST